MPIDPRLKQTWVVGTTIAAFVLAFVGVFLLVQLGNIAEDIISPVRKDKTTPSTEDSSPSETPVPTLLHATQVGTEGVEFAHAVAADASGIYIVGQAGGQIHGTSHEDYTGTEEAFIAKYSPDGAELYWQDLFGTDVTDIGRDIALDDEGVYIVGKTTGALDGELRGRDDVFLRRYSHAGELVWATQFGTNKDDEGIWVVSDGKQVCVGGGTLGVLGAERVGDEDNYVRCFTSDGEELWSVQWGTDAFEESLDAVMNETGLFIVGATGGELTGAKEKGATDAFVSHISLSGDVEWSQQFGSNAVDFGRSIVLGEEMLYVAGRTEGSLKGNTTFGSVDGFIFGIPIGEGDPWSDQVGTETGDAAAGIAFHPTSGVFLAGTKNGKNEKHTVSTGTEDGYVRQYRSTGELLWESDVLTTDGYDEPRGAFVYDDQLIVVGATSGTIGERAFGDLDTFIVIYQLN